MLLIRIRQHWLPLGLLLLVATSAAGREVVVRPVTDVALGRWEVVALPPEEGTPRDALRRAAAGAAAVVVELPAKEGWRLSCAGQGIWCPEVAVAPDAARREIRLPVLATRRLAGELVVPRGEAAPEHLLLQGWIARPGHDPLEVRHRATVADGRFRAELPVPVDLRIAAEGWLPIYRWGVTLDAPDLGRLALRRGGSIAGFAVHHDTELPVADAEVVLEPTFSARAPDRGERVAARTNARGFFTVGPLAAGSYRLTVRSGDPASPAVGRLAGIEVQEGAETLLRDPLVVSSLPHLAIDVEPAVPAPGERWTVELRSGEETLHRQAANEQGQALLPGVEPSRYVVWVRAARGGLAAQQEVDLRQDTRLAFELPLIELRGTLTLGDEPLAAQVRLSTGHEDSWSFTSDAEGRFGGLVRRPDHAVLFANIRSEAPPISLRFEVDDFEFAEDVLQVDLLLHARPLTGFVLDARGHPVPNAAVTVRGASLHTSQRAGRGGRFEITALPPGLYTVQAEAGEAVSEAEEADLRDASLPHSLVLSLTASRPAVILLLGGQGEPLAGVPLELVTAGPAPVRRRATTGRDGRTTLTVPAGTRYASLQALAPASGLWSGCLRLPEATGDEAVVSVPPLPPGRLTVRFEADPDLPPTTRGQHWLITRDGGLVSLAVVERWSRTVSEGPVRDALSDEPDRLHVYRLAPGSYGWIYSDTPSWRLAEELCLAGGPAGVSWATVPPGGTATLDHDQRPAQRREHEARRRR